MTDFTLPELGENVASGDVLRVLVKPGDTLAKDQSVLELETDKATIEVPSSVAGRIRDVKVKAGDQVKVGQVILTVDDGVGEKPEGTRSGGAERGGTENVPAAGSQAIPTAAVPRSAAVATPSVSDKVVDIARAAKAAVEPPSRPAPVAPAAPSVRRMAREVGVDIDQVPGSGPEGRISVDDVKAYAKRLIDGAGPLPGAGPSARAGGPIEPLPDFSRWGAVERQPMRAVRRKTAEHLSAAWSTVPHVTQHDLADITDLEALRKQTASRGEGARGALTITAIAVRIVASALKRFPQFNTSIDVGTGEIIYKKYVNVSVAVDTDRGLLVPVIRHADEKNLLQLSAELSELSEKARTRTITLEEMQGGCFSISNLGGIGGSFFTPIVNVPEVAILGISRARLTPAYARDTGALGARLLLPLSLSYDHRVIDGADGARFLRWVVEAFEQPFLLTLEG